MLIHKFVRLIISQENKLENGEGGVYSIVKFSSLVSNISEFIDLVLALGIKSLIYIYIYNWIVTTLDKGDQNHGAPHNWEQIMSLSYEILGKSLIIDSIQIQFYQN